MKSFLFPVVKEKSNSKRKAQDEDDGGFSTSAKPPALGSTSDIPSQVSAGVSANLASSSASSGGNKSPGFAYCSSKELMNTFSQYPMQRNTPANSDTNYIYSQSSKHRRDGQSKGSEMGYRSDSEANRQRQDRASHGRVEGRTLGYESDREGFTPHREGPRGGGYSSDVEGYRDRPRGGGYSSDVEGYAGRTSNAAYRAASINQQYNNSYSADSRNQMGI